MAVLATAALAFGATACVTEAVSSPSPLAGDASPSTRTQAADAGDAGMFCAYQACQVITAADVAQAMGEPFLTAIPDDMLTLTSPMGMVDLGEQACSYLGNDVGGVVVTFAIACNVQPFDPTPPSNDATPVSVPGAEVGYWSAEGTFGYDQLFVFVDSHRDVLVTVTALDGGIYPVDPLAAATQIAAIAIPRL